MTQREAAWPRFPPTDTIGRCKLALRQLTPAVVLRWVINEAKTIVTQKNRRSTPLPRFFMNHLALESRIGIVDNETAFFVLEPKNSTCQEAKRWPGAVHLKYTVADRHPVS
jgi:hypothetical protein